MLQQDNQTMPNEEKILVRALLLKKDIHRDVEQIQAFIELTTGKRPDKSETCAMLVEEAIPVMKKRMAKYVQK